MSSSNSSGTAQGRRARAAAARAARVLCGLWLALACSKPSAPPSTAATANTWPAEQLHSDASQRQRVALTVYNSNFALVREERRVQLGRGRVALAYADVSAHIQPTSVHLRGLDDPGGLVVLEQNYRYDLLTPEKLLEKYVGHRVSLARYDRAAGADVVRQADVLATTQGPVLSVGGEITSVLPEERIFFPELPPGLTAQPTLVWLLDSARDEQRVEVSYLTQNLSWHADYVLSLAADEAHADLTGWVTLDNQTGTSFTAAELRLVAGDVQRLQPAPPPMPGLRLGGAHASTRDAFQEEPLFEYHLYALQRPTDVLAREQKQVSLLEAQGLAVQKKLVLRSARSDVPNWGRPLPLRHPALVLELENREAAGLGLALPKGVVRVYRADGAGALQFVGEDAIEHTPRDEKLEIELGEAFDIIADRRRLNLRQLERCVLQSEWQTELRNHKDTAVVIEVVEPARPDGKVAESSHPVQQRDATTLVFQVPVPARGSSLLRFRLVERTCP